jgi:hypothetical protein
MTPEDPFFGLFLILGLILAALLFMLGSSNANDTKAIGSRNHLKITETYHLRTWE